MNTARHYERLNTLWAEIARLEGVVVECQREAIEMTGSEEDCQLRILRELQARTELDRARREHGILAHFLIQSLRHANAA